MAVVITEGHDHRDEANGRARVRPHNSTLRIEEHDHAHSRAKLCTYTRARQRGTIGFRSPERDTHGGAGFRRGGLVGVEHDEFSHLEP